MKADHGLPNEAVPGNIVGGRLQKTAAVTDPLSQTGQAA